MNQQDPAILFNVPSGGGGGVSDGNVDAPASFSNSGVLPHQPGSLFNSPSLTFVTTTAWSSSNNMKKNSSSSNGSVTSNNSNSDVQQQQHPYLLHPEPIIGFSVAECSVSSSNGMRNSLTHSDHPLAYPSPLSRSKAPTPTNNNSPGGGPIVSSSSASGGVVGGSTKAATKSSTISNTPAGNGIITVSVPSVQRHPNDPNTPSFPSGSMSTSGFNVSNASFQSGNSTCTQYASMDPGLMMDVDTMFQASTSTSTVATPQNKGPNASLSARSRLMARLTSDSATTLVTQDIGNSAEDLSSGIIALMPVEEP